MLKAIDNATLFSMSSSSSGTIDWSTYISGIADIGKVYGIVDSTGRPTPTYRQNQNVIEVSTEFESGLNRTSTIEAAIILAISRTPSSSKRIEIKIYPGTYNVSAQITIPAFVSIYGTNQNTVTINLDTDITAGLAMVQVTNSTSIIEYVTLNANYHADYVFTCASTFPNDGDYLFQWCSLLHPRVAHVFIDRGIQLICVEIFCFLFAHYAGGTTISAFRCNQAFMLIDFCIAIDAASNDFNGLRFTASPQGRSTTTCSRSTFQSCDIGAHIAGSYVQLYNMEFQNTTVGIQLVASAYVGSSWVTFNNVPTEVIQDSTSLYTALGSGHTTGAQVINNTDNVFLGFTERTLTKQIGYHQEGTVISGSKNIPFLNWSGDGGYNYTGVRFFSFDGTSFVDLSTLLYPNNLTNRSIFGSLAVGSIFYIGDTRTFQTIYLKCSNALTSGVVVAEYWNGSAWTTVNFMVARARTNYGSFQTRLGYTTDATDVRLSTFLKETSPALWTTTVVNGSASLYWIRFRITTVFNAVLNATVCYPLYNSKLDIGGFTALYGTARTLKNLTYDCNLIQGTAGTVPVTQDLFFGANSTLGRTFNKLDNGDRFGLAMFIPSDLDTSSPLRILLAYCNSNIATSPTYTLQITIGSMRQSDLVYFTTAEAVAASIRNQTQINVNLPTALNRQIQLVELFFAIPWLRSRDENGVLNEVFHADLLRTDAGIDDIAFVQIGIQYVSCYTASPFA